MSDHTPPPPSAVAAGSVRPARPLVAIVGRPNVGKSSLFNRLVGQPVAIVDPTPGTTRDRIIHAVRRDGWRFDLVDTGGIGIVDQAKLETDVYRQVERAIGTADRIIFLVDVRDGVLPLDREIAASLRPLAGKVLLAANKVDHDALENDVHQFLSLGLGEPLALSASQGHGISDLLEGACRGLAGAADTGPDDEAAGRIRIAMVGRRNVGKSSLTNALCGEQRVIVADLPGTTRDAVDIDLDRPSGRFTVIDTAGLRKKARMEEDIEFYAACRTERAIGRADVCLLVLDAADEVGMTDKKLAHFCEVEGKPTILVVNKWDLAQKAHSSREAYVAWLRDRLPGLRYAPAVFTCALTGLNVEDLLALAAELHAEAGQRVATAELNRMLTTAQERLRPKRVGSGPTRIYYGTQAQARPPTFIVFVNRTDWMDSGYSRYLENYLRERLPFRRVPLRILFKARDSRFHEHHDRHTVVQARVKAERSAVLVRTKKKTAGGRRMEQGGRRKAEGGKRKR